MDFFFFLIGKLHMHMVGFEPITSLFTLLLQGEDVPFELEPKKHRHSKIPSVSILLRQELKGFDGM